VPTQKWVSYIKGPYRKGLEKQSIYSTRFGFLDLYSGQEQLGLICPSGYNIRQCFGVLGKLWCGYHKARTSEKLEQMEKYAKGIQNVQKDMGIKTTSFPHLGLYGDVFILNNKKGERIVFEDHSELKRQQEEYEKQQVENAKKIQEKLQKPDKEKGEEIESFADDVSPYEMEDYEETVPDLLEPDEEKEEEVITIADEIPFKHSKNK
jgi:predicted KAP-like P-loop ATPase